MLGGFRYPPARCATSPPPASWPSPGSTPSAWAPLRRPALARASMACGIALGRWPALASSAGRRALPWPRRRPRPLGRASHRQLRPENWCSLPAALPLVAPGRRLAAAAPPAARGAAGRLPGRRRRQRRARPCASTSASPALRALGNRAPCRRGLCQPAPAQPVRDPLLDGRALSCFCGRRCGLPLAALAWRCVVLLAAGSAASASRTGLLQRRAAGAGAAVGRARPAGRLLLCAVAPRPYAAGVLVLPLLLEA